MSVYMISNGLSAKANDTTHAMGVAMSHKWKYVAAVTLSEAANDALRDAVHV